MKGSVEHPEREYQEAVRTPVGIWPGREQHAAGQALTNLTTQPRQVSDVVVRDVAGELDFERDQPSVGSLGDERLVFTDRSVEIRQKPLDA